MTHSGRDSRWINGASSRRISPATKSVLAICSSSKVIPIEPCISSARGRCKSSRPVDRLAPTAILRAGSVIGEPGLFSDVARMANVEAMTPCEVWALRGPRLEELSQRLPALALELIRAAGGVMYTRMRNNLLRQIPFS
jgi:CRP-like cAMP-binding protein